MLSIEPLSIDSIPAASEMLARAFVEDPFFTYVDPNPETRFERVRRFLQVHTHATALLGGAFVTAGNLRGISLWIPPGKQYGPEIERAAGLPDLPEIFGPEATARLANLGQAFGDAHEALAPDPHHYLSILGVDPSWHGQGIGSALLRSYLAEVDRQGGVCYLETTRARNVPLYERFGFVAGEKRHVEGVDFWPFRRDARRPIMDPETR